MENMELVVLMAKKLLKINHNYAQLASASNSRRRYYIDYLGPEEENPWLLRIQIDADPPGTPDFPHYRTFTQCLARIIIEEED